MTRLSKPVAIALTSRAILAFCLAFCLAAFARRLRARPTQLGVRINSRAARRGASDVRAAVRAMDGAR